MTVAMLSFLVVFHEIRHELLISFSMVLQKFDVIAFGIIAFLFFFFFCFGMRMLSLSCIYAKREFLLITLSRLF